MIKVIFPLLLVVGLASASPLFGSRKTSTPTIQEEFDDFYFALLLASNMKYLMPREFAPFINSLSPDDLKAVRYAWEHLGSDKLQLFGQFEKKFPGTYKNFMTAAKKFFKRCNALPLKTKRALATIVYVNYLLRHDEKKHSYELQKSNVLL
uniref:Uncharacterized protein n=1 Tax=Steinernema glaseri TaxID=37863 RepID=A0A1I7YBF6_9BILA